MVERDLAKVEVASSTLVSRSKISEATPSGHGPVASLQLFVLSNFGSMSNAQCVSPFGIKIANRPSRSTNSSTSKDPKVDGSLSEHLRGFQHLWIDDIDRLVGCIRNDLIEYV